MNILTVIEMLRFISPILIGILLNQLTVSNELLHQWEQVFFYQNAFSFAYLWAISQIQLTLVPADPSYRSALSKANALIGLAIASVVVLTLCSTIDNIALNVILFFFSFFLINGQPLEYHFYTIHRHSKVLFAVLATHIIGIIYVAIIYYLFANEEPLLKSLTGLTVLHGLRTIVWWHIAPLYPSSPRIIKLVKNAFSLWGSYLLAGSALYVDGWLVEHYLDADFFLYFRYGAREFPLSTIIASGLSASFAFHIAKVGIHHEPTKVWIRNKIHRFQRIIFPISIVLLCCSHLLFGWFYQERYSASALFFDGFLLLTVSRVIFSQSYMLALGLQKKMLTITIVEFMLHIALSSLLIPILGWRAIVISTICAYFYEKIAFIHILRKQGFNYWNIHPVTEFVLGSSLLGLIYLLKYIIL